MKENLKEAIHDTCALMADGREIPESAIKSYQDLIYMVDRKETEIKELESAIGNVREALSDYTRENYELGWTVKMLQMSYNLLKNNVRLRKDDEIMIVLKCRYCDSEHIICGGKLHQFTCENCGREIELHETKLVQVDVIITHVEETTDGRNCPDNSAGSNTG
jgi:transcription elongation factor Elf1